MRGEVQTEAVRSDRKVAETHRFVPSRTIVVVGLMGAGKSKVGRRLALRLGLPFFDSDREIETAAGETIEEIFANRGERVFRAGERRAVVERCDAPALALYLVLVTVADAQGLSYYGEATLSRLLSMPAARLRQARLDLIRLELIAYERPLYQVLSLDPPPPSREHALLSTEARIAALRTILADQRGSDGDA